MGAKTEGGRLRRIVTNTGPALHLHEIKMLHLLNLAGEVFIPEAVQAELNSLIPNWGRIKPEWLKVESLSPSSRRKAEAWVQAGLVDAGEAEAIILAKQLGADWLLTDDAAARLIARSLGLEVHGSLGVVLWAAARRYLSRAEAEAALDRLFFTSHCGFHHPSLRKLRKPWRGYMRGDRSGRVDKSSFVDLSSLLS